MFSMRMTHARVMSELYRRMTLARRVNNVISDGCHIDKDNITNFLDILHAYPDLVSVIDHCGEVFMNVHQLLRTTSSIPTHDKCIIIRIILWQYCKILPYLTENEGLLYCGLYSDLNLESDRVSTSLHTQCLLFTALGVLSGALVSLGLTAMMT